MNFNIDRLSRLAGISQGNGGSQVLSEAGNRSNHEEEALKKEKVIQHGTQLNETEGLHADPEGWGTKKDLGNPDEGPALEEDDERSPFEWHAGDESAGDPGSHDLGREKGDLGAGAHSHEIDKYGSAADREGDLGAGSHDHEEDYEHEGDRGGDENISHTGTDYAAMDEVFEIDERDLVNELRRMKQERIQENQLREAIRTEVRSILDGVDLNISSDWVYGSKKPQRSRQGQVARGFASIGFK